MRTPLKGELPDDALDAFTEEPDPLDEPEGTPSPYTPTVETFDPEAGAVSPVDDDHDAGIDDDPTD